MILFNTKTNQVIFDAIEQKTTKPNLSLWLYGDSGRLITFSDELEDNGYVFLSEDAPEVIKARKALKNKEKLIEQERKLDNERKAQEEAEKLNKIELLEKEKRHSERLGKIVPDGDKMPKWFYEYANNLKINRGKQDRIRQTYDYSKEEWIDYFDSSFPSTFLASYKIVRNLLENNEVISSYKGLKKIRLADIGCGSGGASIGAITAIEQFLPNVLEIDICAFDYNENALEVFENCLEKYHSDNGLIKFHKQQIEFVPEHSDAKHNKYTLIDFGDKYLANNEFDFILCFKMVNELIFNHSFKKNTYEILAQVASPRISKKGFFILLDVSMSNEGDANIDNTQYAKLLNSGIKTFLYQNADNYGCIIPIPCAIVSTNCKADLCWIQRLIKSDGGREFPATYKVLTKKSFRDQILKSIKAEDSSKYIVCEKKEKDDRPKAYKRCFYSNGKRTQSDEITESNKNDFKDGFSLINYGG